MRVSAFLAILIFAAVVTAEVYGIRTGDLFSQPIWSPIGLTRFGHFTVWFLALVVPALFLIPRFFISIAVGLIFLATVVSTGPAAVFAVVFFLVSVCALGALVLREKEPGSPEADVRSVLAGTGIFIFLMTLMARFPVNYPLVWGALLAAPILANLRGTTRRLARWGRLLGSAKLTSWAERAAFAALLFSFTMTWLVTLKPETGTDGLAMHLAIVNNIAAHHAMTFQPGRLLWSVMPMGGDWIFSITGLFGGEMAARLINLAMLLLIELQIWTAVRRLLPRPVCLLLLALFTTTPMVELVTGSLFIENLLAAVILGAVTALGGFAATGEKKSLYLAMGLSGTALATKFGALSIAGFIVLFAAFEVLRRRKSNNFRPLLTFALAGLLFLGAAAPSYAIAWWKTRDPLYPFLNRQFPSPVLDHNADLNDPRFRQPVTWETPFDLTFRTHLYYEGQDGSLGFQFLLIVPLALLGGVALKRRDTSFTALVATGGFLAVLIALPNARYMYPALTLFAIPFAVFLNWIAANRRWLYYACLVFLAACVGLNIWFFPAAGWYQKDFYAKNPFSPAGREAFLRDEFPLRYIVRKFSRDHPQSPVYLATAADIADIEGDAYGAFSHQWPILMQIRATRGVPNLARLFRQWKIKYFIVEGFSGSETSDIRDFITVCSREQFRDGAYSLAVLRPECDTDDQPTLKAVADSLLPPLQLVQQGTYDDADKAVQFRGTWAHSTAFSQADLQTISFSESPDSEVALAFEGTALIYVFTRAPNRGRAEVTIDGVSKGTIDLYSPAIEWQSTAKFCCLAKGRHTAVVRVTGEKSKDSTGVAVDLDSFAVE